MVGYSVDGNWLATVGSSGLPFVLALIPLSILLVLWLLLARSSFIQGDDMERPSRVAQLYGYSVCLVAVIVFLASTNSLLENAFALGDPLQPRESFYPYGASLTSFEAFRATYDRERQERVMPGQTVAPDTTPEPVLRARYEALRADRIAANSFQARRGLATSGLSLLLALGLFVVHWRWLRPRTVAPVGGGDAAV